MIFKWKKQNCKAQWLPLLNIPYIPLITLLCKTFLLALAIVVIVNYIQKCPLLYNSKYKPIEAHLEDMGH